MQKKKPQAEKKKENKNEKRKKEKVKCITVCTVIHFTVHCDIKNRSNKSEEKKKT